MVEKTCNGCGCIFDSEYGDDYLCTHCSNKPKDPYDNFY